MIFLCQVNKSHVTSTATNLRSSMLTLCVGLPLPKVKCYRAETSRPTARIIFNWKIVSFNSFTGRDGEVIKSPEFEGGGNYHLITRIPSHTFKDALHMHTNITKSYDITNIFFHVCFVSSRPYMVCVCVLWACNNC